MIDETVFLYINILAAEIIVSAAQKGAFDTASAGLPQPI
jgi:hypothetical protein